MSRKIQGWALLAALAITLMAAPSAQAAPLGGWVDASGLLARAWRWMAGVGTEVGPRGVNGPSKAGPGSDPNGSQGIGTQPPTSATTDSGIGTDPNGG
jgi:hypothetical protein